MSALFRLIRTHTHTHTHSFHLAQGFVKSSLGIIAAISPCDGGGVTLAWWMSIARSDLGKHYHILTISRTQNFDYYREEAIDWWTTTDDCNIETISSSSCHPHIDNTVHYRHLIAILKQFPPPLVTPTSTTRYTIDIWLIYWNNFLLLLSPPHRQHGTLLTSDWYIERISSSSCHPHIDNTVHYRHLIDILKQFPPPLVTPTSTTRYTIDIWLLYWNNFLLLLSPPHRQHGTL